MRLPGRRSRCKEELVYPSERKRMEQVAEFATKAFERHVIIQNVSQYSATDRGRGAAGTHVPGPYRTLASGLLQAQAGGQERGVRP